MAQTVYKVVDEQGNVTFTDTPPSGAIAEEQSINATNTTPVPQWNGDAATADSEAARAVDSQSFETRITTPADQATIPMGPGNFVVEVAVSPALRIGRTSHPDAGWRIGWRTPTSRKLATDQRLSGRTSTAGVAD